MTFEVFIFVVTFCIGVTVLINTYVNRSLRSYQSASAMLGHVTENLEELTKSEPPVGVARLGFMLASTAGCGCYVRAVLMSRYLPTPLASSIFGGSGRGKSKEVEHDMFDLDKLTPEQRQHFSKLVASVIVYDGYRNPLSGWAFRKMMDAHTETSYTQREGAELTIFSVLARKASTHTPKLSQARVA